MAMRRKAGLLLGAAAVIAAVAFTTNVFGAGGPATLQRADAIKASVRFTDAPSKAGKALPKTLYGAATVSIPNGDRSIQLGKCPRRSHIINATVGALHGSQAKYLTIRGSGITVAGKGKTPNAWFIDVSNTFVDATTGNPLSIKGVASIICQKD